MNTKPDIWVAWELRTAPWTQNLRFEFLGNSEQHHKHKTWDLSCLGIQNCTMNTKPEIWFASELRELHHEHKTWILSCLGIQKCTLTLNLRFDLLGNSELHHENKTSDLSCLETQNCTINTKPEFLAAWEFRNGPLTQNLRFELLGNSELHHEHKTSDLSCLETQNCSPLDSFLYKQRQRTWDLYKVSKFDINQDFEKFNKKIINIFN